MTRTTRKLAGGATAVLENGKVVEIISDSSPMPPFQQIGEATYDGLVRTDTGGCRVCRGDRHPTPGGYVCPDCQADIDDWKNGA